MLTKSIFFKNFRSSKINKKIKKNLTSLLQEESHVIKSLGKFYKNSYTQKNIKKIKTNFNVRVIGIGGSMLGAESIYSFLSHKIKKKIEFISNLCPNYSLSKKKIY